MDFDLTLTGLDLNELDRLLKPETDPPIPDIPEGNPITTTGDIWLLGDHRLLCGDATKAEDVAKVLDGDTPNLMVTDPPWGVEYDADWRNEAKRPDGTPYGASATGKVTNDERSDWGEAFRLFPGATIYCWSSAGTNSVMVWDSLVGSGFEVRMQIIWAKNVAPIGRGHYHVKHEPCWYAVRKGKTADWIGGRKQTTVWEIDKPQKSETGHSTQKPVEGMERPMRNHKGDVYDPFLGSGTTLIAAERTRRKCYAIEIEPKYCDVSIRRWQLYTGKKAVLESTGEAFPL